MCFFETIKLWYVQISCENVEIAIYLPEIIFLTSHCSFVTKPKNFSMYLYKESKFIFDLLSLIIHIKKR
jgi:hypothetical protein